MLGDGVCYMNMCNEMGGGGVESKTKKAGYFNWNGDEDEVWLVLSGLAGSVVQYGW